MTYHAHKDIDLVLERLVVLNFTLLHGFDGHLFTYTQQEKFRHH